MSQISSWHVPLDTSHSVGINPLSCTQDHREVTSWAIFSCRTKRAISPQRRLLITSSLSSTDSCRHLLWAFFAISPFNEVQHPLFGGRDTFWIGDTKRLIFLLFASSASLITLSLSFSLPFPFSSDASFSVIKERFLARRGFLVFPELLWYGNWMTAQCQNSWATIPVLAVPAHSTSF